MEQWTNENTNERTDEQKWGVRVSGRRPPPLVLENVQADAPVVVYVGVEHARLELHHRGFVRIILRKRQVELKRAPFPRRVLRAESSLSSLGFLGFLGFLGLLGSQNGSVLQLTMNARHDFALHLLKKKTCPKQRARVHTRR